MFSNGILCERLKELSIIMNTSLIPKNNILVLFLGSVSRRSAYFDEGFGPVQFTSVQCDGTETRLQDCAYTTENTCTHSTDAGVTCVGRSLEVPSRL